MKNYLETFNAIHSKIDVKELLLIRFRAEKNHKSTVLIKWACNTVLWEKFAIFKANIIQTFCLFSYWITRSFSLDAISWFSFLNSEFFSVFCCIMPLISDKVELRRVLTSFLLSSSSLMRFRLSSWKNISRISKCS